MKDERLQRLQKAIADSGMTYAELEEKTGIAKSSLQRYATGATKKIPIDFIEAIARVANVSLEYLLCLDRREIKLTIEGVPKEIADLVSALQSQPKKTELHSPKDLFEENFTEYLQKNIRDTNEEKPN